MSRYVIIDLEMCVIPEFKRSKEFTLKNELIQIGAVLLDENLEIADTYMSYVSPEYGTIDRFIENLTGISRSDTADAPSAKEALTDFVSWLPDDAVLVSWSRNDEHQIRHEVESKRLEIPGLGAYLENWMDCQETFAEKMNNPRSYKLSEALIITGIDYSDGEHDALVDARNTALLFAKMEREEELQLSPYYLNQQEQPRAYNPFAALLGKFGSSD